VNNHKENMMGFINKFQGEIEGAFNWENQRHHKYGDVPGASKGASIRWLIGQREQTENFALRYFELEPGGHSIREQHAHDHGVIAVRGKAIIHMGDEQFELEPMDVAYIPGNEWHQLINAGEGIFGFFCIIPAKRMKGDKEVYAEGNWITKPE
jgi:ribulose-bisphosphate carboxylase large chain